MFHHFSDSGLPFRIDSKTFAAFWSKVFSVRLDWDMPFFLVDGAPAPESTVALIYTYISTLYELYYKNYAQGCIPILYYMIHYITSYLHSFDRNRNEPILCAVGKIFELQLKRDGWHFTFNRLTRNIFLLLFFLTRNHVLS